MGGKNLIDKILQRIYESTDCDGCINTCCCGKNLSLEDGDIFRLFTHLKMSPEKFRDEYTILWGPRRLLRFHNDRCPFLNDNGRCNVHIARPLACRQYPFKVKDGCLVIRQIQSCDVSKAFILKFIQYYEGKNDALVDRVLGDFECGVEDITLDVKNVSIMLNDE